MEHKVARYVLVVGPLVVAATVGAAAFATTYGRDLYWRAQYRRATSDLERVEAVSKLAHVGNARSIDCLVDALCRVSKDSSVAVHNNLVFFCVRHWGHDESVDRVLDVELARGRVQVFVKALPQSSAVKILSSGKTLYDVQLSFSY